MANFNPFAKKTNETIETEEVDLLPDDSIAYFNEKLNEKRAKVNEANRKVLKKKQELISVFGNLENENQKREMKKQEILNNIEKLKEEQREIAQQIALGTGNEVELEKKLNKLSVNILSEQAKAEAFNEHIRFYLPKDIRVELKKRMKDFNETTREYIEINSDRSLSEQVRQVIKELEDIADAFRSDRWIPSRTEDAATIVKPYIKYFISEEELEELFAGNKAGLEENYFSTWLGSDSEQTFSEYARYLLSL